MLKKILLSTLICTTLSTPVIGKVNAEEVKQDKPVKYVFKSGGKASPIYINSDGSMTIPEKEILEVFIERPSDYYVVKNGVKTYEVTPKYKHIWDQWAYYDFYASKGRTADLFVGEHPRPLDGVTFVPKSDNTSDNQKADDQKDEPKSDQPKDQPEPNKNTTDNQSTSDQPKQDVLAKVEQPAKVDKKSNSQGNVIDKKDATDQNKSDTNKDNKAVANNKSNDQNKVAVNNQKSEPQSSDVSKKVDVKKEDNNKDVKAKSTDSKAKAADNKSDKQQKELPKTGESENPWIQVGLLSLVGLSLIGLYTINRKSKA
ncbi:LPXTG cell wall anchor domain-containing protein [Mammaliicoccus sciuri]|uniref:LPXTG cell wall anchor domain-containing protein n=2 Tax=Mammaliicoccus sciuri TaxID=1296 RepID=UPI000E68603A|nr:LPXTG cell wall anchor domain-containing protein [Mammaliicoccus sciuri]RIN77170.1 LPXTG cell wall anchor domain-containing protein [Mammaliicoccus sciuri]